MTGRVSILLHVTIFLTEEPILPTLIPIIFLPFTQNFYFYENKEMPYPYQKEYYTYITTNVHKTVLYTGVTNNIVQRIVEHYLNSVNKKTFAGKYNAFYLIYYETYRYVTDAIAREKQIKGWRRERKVALINTQNPNWDFLNVSLLGEWPPSHSFHRGM